MNTVKFSASASLLKGFCLEKLNTCFQVILRDRPMYLVKAGTANLLVLSYANFPLIIHTPAKLLVSMRLYGQYFNVFLFRYKKEAEE